MLLKKLFTLGMAYLFPILVKRYLKFYYTGNEVKSRPPLSQVEQSLNFFYHISNIRS